MSTYISDREFHEEHTNDAHIDGTFIDAASDCFGRDVRIIVDHQTIYLTPTQARAFAAAIRRRAQDTIDRRGAR